MTPVEPRFDAVLGTFLALLDRQEPAGGMSASDVAGARPGCALPGCLPYVAAPALRCARGRRQMAETSRCARRGRSEARERTPSRAPAIPMRRVSSGARYLCRVAAQGATAVKLGTPDAARRTTGSRRARRSSAARPRRSGARSRRCAGSPPRARRTAAVSGLAALSGSTRPTKRSPSACE